MRIVHLSDTHLGFRQLHHVDASGRNVREQDVYRAFEQAIATAIELEPVAVIHSGDLFDSYHPASAALRVALDGFARLRDAGIAVVLIAGNHSTPRVAAAEHVFSVLERFGGAHVVYAEPQVVRIGDLAVHAIPHDNDAERVAAALREVHPRDDTAFNVAVAHIGLDILGHVVGAEAGGMSFSGEVLENTAGFDYVALGHLHKFAPARENAAYAGSLERLSWADDAPVKGILEIDLAAGQRSRDYLRLHRVDTRPHIVLDPIDALDCEQLTDAIVARAEQTGVETLRGALVRLTVQNVTPAVWSAVDHKAIAGAFAECLHFEREAVFVGQSRELECAPELREFLLQWPGAQRPEIDSEDFIARAEAFVARADEELAARDGRG
ncbi:MAG: metallophosphoesterase family protein [Solirubrobacteraceae bacterium]